MTLSVYLHFDQDNFRKVIDVRKKLIGNQGDTLITPYRVKPHVCVPCSCCRCLVLPWQPIITKVHQPRKGGEGVVYRQLVCFTHTETFEGRWASEVFSKGEAAKDVLLGECLEKLGGWGGGGREVVAMIVSCLSNKLILGSTSYQDSVCMDSFMSPSSPSHTPSRTV